MSKEPKKPQRDSLQNVADNWRRMLRRAKTRARFAEVILNAVFAGVPTWKIESYIDCLENVRARFYARQQNLTAVAWRRLAAFKSSPATDPQVRR
ncbi:MAG: hypothetical protein HQ567_23965 [Candidatus Nealsonbacteria bacterium]|nr:hypothetical protein [Candidatus Nealsonbacteria bacterium]